MYASYFNTIDKERDICLKTLIDFLHLIQVKNNLTDRYKEQQNEIYIGFGDFLL
jgi:hypothetical protein